MTPATKLSRRRAVLVALAALPAIALAAASGGTAAAEPSAAASATKTVTIRGLAFQPANLTVNRGTTVTWVNSSRERHTATRAGSFDRQLKPGKSASVRFGQRGTFRYHCTLHPTMKGKIVVK